jgi:hypothetical protein
MGFEFKIYLPNLDTERSTRVLRSAPFYSDYDASHDFFNFRDPNTDSSSWPAVWAKLEPDGIYLCHNGDRAIFQSVVDHIRQNLAQDSDKFRMDEL